MAAESKSINLDCLSKDELIKLVESAANRDPDIAAKVELALAGKQGGNVLASQIKRKISGLKRSKKFYNYREAHLLDRKLEDLRSVIVDDLGALDCNVAIDCAEKLLDIHPHILESVDDSAGIVWPVLQNIVAGLATLYKKLPKLDRRALAEKVFYWNVNQDYNTYDDVIRDFGPVLGEAGLNVLEKMYRDYYESSSETDNSSDSFRQYTVRQALLEIADARRDVDQYIAVLEEFDELAGYNYVQVIRRLLAAERPQEALDLLDAPDNKQDDLKLRTEALQALGRCEEAQACRLKDLLSYPTVHLYKDLLTRATNPDAIKEKVLNELPATASKHALLGFLIEIDEFEQAATLVLRNVDAWDGGQYYTLEPAAKVLSQEYPLVATVLYRALIDDILARAKSRYYHHAVRYLLLLDQLQNRITTWSLLANHQEYIQTMKEDHKYKRALWGKLSDAGWCE